MPGTRPRADKERAAQLSVRPPSTPNTSLHERIET
jgi:hypothetical protein